MPNSAGFSIPHRRYNPLTGRWLLVSPQRILRPWSGQSEKTAEQNLPLHDPVCYLCPGNTRNTGAKNPRYQSVYSFINDFPAIVPEVSPKRNSSSTEFFTAHPEQGVCEVLCYSPLHNKNMAGMDVKDLKDMVNFWQDRTHKLGGLKYINHVQIFENRGNEAGNSNLHPHCQIWAQQSIPHEVQSEIKHQEKYFRATGHSLLDEYLRQELKHGIRILFRNKTFTALVPFWAEWPYETMVLPNTHIQQLDQLSKKQTCDLADALSLVTKAYASLFNRPRYGAPYTMGVHQKPFDGKASLGVQMHIHFQPPLLTHGRQKFMVGYERFGEPQRDIPAEQAASELRQHLDKLKVVGG